MHRRPLKIAVLAGSTLASITGVAAPISAALAATTHTYRGPAETFRNGTVRVTITVKSHKVTTILATSPTDTARSIAINAVAIPELRTEALKAQSAKINAVSGATLTSGAFIASLAGALKDAHV